VDNICTFTAVRTLSLIKHNLIHCHLLSLIVKEWAVPQKL
jgi:hypothetical protein